MVALEEEQEKLHSLEEGHRRAGADWSTKQANLQQEHEGLGEALASLEDAGVGSSCLTINSAWKVRSSSCTRGCASPRVARR